MPDQTQNQIGAPAPAALPGGTLAKTFDPAAIEARWYAYWEANGLFRPARADAPPFTIVNPPPNVTGSLHIGHALDNTLQDVIVRHERLKGKDALWVVGTDHAGIATQMVVERQLEERQDRRANYTREEFIAKVWEWKAASGGTITGQLRRLGCSMDWRREQFTMSPEFNRAVTRVFVDLYDQGLIYRDKRLVNWDPKLKTAISDLEVEQREVKGHFWHFRYPLADGERLNDGRDYIVIATTRPETILGDGAVAVHPADDRYRHLVGKRCRLPIVDRLIPIIADDHVREDFGSGAVKITAAHDNNDYEVARRHPQAHIPLINLMNADATMSDACPPEYRGKDRYEARAMVIARFESLGLLDYVEDHVHQVPFGDRSGVVIEPWLTDQWYVDAAKLAGAPMEAVRDGRIEIVPGSWEKTFFNWMENIQPWCVSRQLWWGHRIPAWYGPDGAIFVAETEAAARQLAGDMAITRDEDVLDTWFSSALWPFATLGWPLSSPSSDGEGDHAQHGGGVPLSLSAAPEGPASTPPPSSMVPLPGGAGEDGRVVYKLPPRNDASDGEEDNVSSPSSDGEGDHAQHGGGVPLSLSAATEDPASTPPPSSMVPLPGGAGEDGRVLYKLPPRNDASVLRARAMRRAMPPSEALLWRLLKDRPGGLKFRRQHPAGDYVLDFFCPAAGLAIEIDGEAHERGDRPQRDETRDAFLRGCGVEVLRVPARDVFHDANAVVATIVARAGERLPLHHPAGGPPPRRAGEDGLLARHYPNDLLISGFDILFFWCARMAMQGMHFMGDVPWKRLYLHGLVRAADGAKMSKSKGNVVDPLILIDKYGADALRFFMAAMESQGRDVKMDERRVEGYRNFATKLWNAARFCQANGIGASTSLAAPPATLAVNRWIIGEVVDTLAVLDKALADLRFDAAANAIYHFVWDRFCDWYLELIKGQIDDETRAVAGWVLDQILVMLHPFMPFVTEELWQALGERETALIVARWPEPAAAGDAGAKREVEWLIALVGNVRAAKAELGIPPGARLEAYCADGDGEVRAIVARHGAAIDRVARLSAIRFTAAPDGASMQVGAGTATLLVPLTGVIDLAAEQARLGKALAAAAGERDSLEKRLANASFVERARPEAVDKARADHAAHAAEAERLGAALARLG